MFSLYVFGTSSNKMAAVQKVSEAQGLMVVISKLSELAMLIVVSRCNLNPLTLCMKFCFMSLFINMATVQILINNNMI